MLIWRRTLWSSLLVLIPVYYFGPKYTIKSFMKQVRERNARLEEMEKMDMDQLDEIDFSKIELNRIDLEKG